VRFDAFTRGRYATDASIYQIMPLGVVLPKSTADVAAALEIAREYGTPVIARGAGTSQNGQPIGAGLIVDFSRHLDRVLDYDAQAGTVSVEPGVVLERLNARLKPDGWFFPVEPSTASRCTLGGMAGNNASGARSIRYGKMVDNVLAIEALLCDGERVVFGPSSPHGAGAAGSQRACQLGLRVLELARRERDEILRRYPKLQRRVGGYNLDALIAPEPNLAHLLVGSEGTLAVTTALTLKLTRLPAHRAMGICQFPDFRAAMEATRHLVALGPTAVELADNNVLRLGADIPLFRDTLADITRGRPDCLLIVEFAGDGAEALKRDLKRLAECMGDLGFPNAVVDVPEPARQRAVWDLREACLNIMMSMKGDAKPVSFIEDCAVPLERLADYTSEMTALFARYGTRGTWYAHASVGCLHVRPILDMKSERDIKAMRAIAEAAVDLVKRFEGSFSGEHGDGISRSEFIAPMFGERLARAFAEVKEAFDPEGALNPGKIVRPYAMDDRSLMRFPADYRPTEPAAEALDWSEWGGFSRAVEMCNNNGACRQTLSGVMCPSFRVTSEEQHVTRGRANTLRLAISGQLGPDAFTSEEMRATLELCVSCKACKRECPTGVDVARMKIEFLHHYHAQHGLSWRSRLIAHLPRYAPYAARLALLMNMRNRVPSLARLSERWLGFSARRRLPEWKTPWRDVASPAQPQDVVGDGRDAVLFADTFSRYFEPENLQAAQRVLSAAGYRLHNVSPGHGARPLCCGRTHLAAGLVDEARFEMRRTLAALHPFVAAGARIVGLEPSCLLTFRDELLALLPAAEAKPIAAAAQLLEECLAADLASGKVALPLTGQQGRIAHLHGHCHQKAFGLMNDVERVLQAIPGLEVRSVQSSCCGMAGAFGYEADKVDVSLAMAELSLFPALRKARPDDLIVADGFSCRQQIAGGLGREALHTARVLARSLGASVEQMDQRQ
jgi:FAD/FMN-containing dehydrogenase/Fe-S oxidoreductase